MSAVLEVPQAARTLRGYPVAGIIALAAIVALVLLALLAPYVAPFDPDRQSLLNQYRPPSWEKFLLGTDRYGRDELSRLIFGSRVSLIAALIGTAVAAGVGVPLGMAAGFAGGAAGRVLSFLNDALMSVPALILGLTAIAIIGPGLVNAMLVVGVIFSPTFFRLARSATQDVRHETFIEASRATGCSTWRTLWRHVLPNCLTPLVIQAAVIAGACVTAEAGLSFLGLGVRPPTASWGSMMSNAAQDIQAAPLLVYFPGLAIALTVLAFSTLGDWLRARLGTQRRPA